MFKNLINYILNNIFKISTETTQKEITDNQAFANAYKNIQDINFDAIFSNKLANYVVYDSNLNITGENKRSDLLSKTGNSMWKKAKKITAMSLGYGGLVIVPYVKGGKLFYNLVSQDRLTIDETDGENITRATILAEKRTVTGTISTKAYYRWTHFSIENGNAKILQQYSDEDGNKIATPDFWKNIVEEIVIGGVDRVLFGFVKSPINNRNSNDKYGVPITYGCESTILEIKECLSQIVREYELKQAFVGVDYTMFNDKNGKLSLPKDGLYRLFNADKDEFWQLFDPAIRESSYYTRLQELYARLEKQIGTSKGVLTEIDTHNATATEIKKALFDTMTIVDDMRTNLEKGFDDFFYACNVLANAYNLTPAGEYELSFDWSYALVEDEQQTFQNLITGLNNGLVSKSEVRQWMKPNETIEESEKAIEEIKASEPSIQDLLGTREPEEEPIKKDEE